MSPNGKVAIVTGASSGIGRVTAVELALKGFHVFLACRSQNKTQVVLQEISLLSNNTAKADFLPLDLGDLKSVRHCAHSFLERKLPLHLLVNNAGLAGQRGVTASGFELTFGTCHVGHFLLTDLLIDRLKHSTPARIVVVASKAHRHANRLDYNSFREPTRSASGLQEYAAAKLANILFASELARRLHGTGVTTYSLHPGVVATDVWRSLPWGLDWLIKKFMISAQEGAATILHCATSPQCATSSGEYFDNCALRQPSKAACDIDEANKLWKASEAWLREADS